jgi:hypothetical protein
MCRESFPGATVLLETWLQGPDGEDLRYRADVFVRPNAGGRAYVLDVKLVNPAAAEYLEAGSASVALAAADAGEEEKRGRWARVQDALPDVVFIPFVMEITGRYGKAAKAFLQKMELEEAFDFQKSEPLAIISVALAMYNARLVEAGRSAYKEHDLH